MCDNEKRAGQTSMQQAEERCQIKVDISGKLRTWWREKDNPVWMTSLLMELHFKKEQKTKKLQCQSGYFLQTKCLCNGKLFQHDFVFSFWCWNIEITFSIPLVLCYTTIQCCTLTKTRCPFSVQNISHMSFLRNMISVWKQGRSQEYIKWPSTVGSRSFIIMTGL